ncbi:unnamed protein product [Clonostachys rosea]|uniref:Uncharacterized protein n=1 Tax=Bionectria ochroleuca TaxID=29856 RepID=A0ABY6V1P4_BIOOC|nr:unnamed protein product [Clonostachys rosea]
MEFMQFSNALEVRGFTERSRSDTYPFIDPALQDLEGKSVCITGASRGLGKAMAVAFASAGCSKIALAARGDVTEVADKCRESADRAGRSVPTIVELSVDVTSEESLDNAATRMSEAFDGSLDILINNAGYSEAPSRVADKDSDSKEWWRTWEVNVKGVYLCCRAFMPLILASKSKTICNLTSGAAFAISGLASAYGGTKFALCRFGEHLDAQYGKEGLLIHSVEPGAVLTDLASQLHPDFRPYLTDTAELVSNTLVWLTAERREWLSPRIICSNWDMEDLLNKKETILAGDLLKFRLTIL